MKKKYCFEKGQLQNIAEAASGNPEACEKAKEFVKNDLELPELTAATLRKKGGYPKGLGMGQRPKKKKEPLTVIEVGAKEIVRRGRQKASSVVSWLFGNS